MKKRVVKFTFLLIALAFFAYSGLSEETFSGQRILQHVKVLSSDEFQGRKSGLAGGEKASNWIAERFKEWGITPASDKGYFQDFENPFFNVDGDVLLKILSPTTKRTFYYEDDWRVIPFSGSGKISAELVFAGYGIISEKNRWNEYENISVKDKVVLVVNGYPPFLEGKLEEESLIGAKVENAYKNGAKGIIFVYKPGETPQRVRLSIPPEKFKKDFIAIFATENVLNFIFSEVPTDFRYLMQIIDREKKVASTSLPVRVEISAKTTVALKRKMRNVIAKIDGVDPVLKNEYVIIGAHMDHLGISPTGEVYNGANDNASGTAVVMEIARVMKAENIKPKRTIVFALWAGEEQGLLGSRYYSDHPLFPIEKTVAYFNLDMVGHGDGRINFPGIYYGPEIWNILKQKLPEEIMKDINASRGGPGGSDHTSFLIKGVPGFGIMTSGYHFKYHRPRDDFDLIKPEVLEKVANFLYNALKIISNEESLKIPDLREELYILRSSTVAGFLEKDASVLIDESRSVEFFDLDIGFMPLKGNSINEIINLLADTSEKIEQSRNISILTSPSQFQTNSRMGKLSILLGVEDIKEISKDLRILKLLSKGGLGYVVLKDNDFENSQELKKGIKILNDSGILIFVKSSTSDYLKEIIEASTKPGIILSSSLEPEIQKLAKEKKWKAGIPWKKEQSPEEFLKVLDALKDGLGYGNIIIFKENLPFANFSDEFLKMISLLKGKNLKREEINGMLGQGLIDLLYQIKGEERRVMPFIPF